MKVLSYLGGKFFQYVSTRAYYSYIFYSVFLLAEYNEILESKICSGNMTYKIDVTITKITIVFNF